MVYSCNGILHSMRINHVQIQYMQLKSHKYNVEQKKPDTTECTRFDSIHIISKTRQNYSMLLKFRIEVTFWVVVTGREYEGGPGLLAILLIVLGADCMHVFCCEISLTCLSILYVTLQALIHFFCENGE